MNLEYAINQLSHNPNTIQQLIHNIPEEHAQWKPDTNTWSMVEVMQHLVDEERQDFRARLEHILYHRQDKWQPLSNEPTDPQGDLQTLFKMYREERHDSIKWLKSLSNVDWSIEFETPFRVMSAGNMLSSWVVHDILHIRQFVELKWAITTRDLEPYDVDYAGEW